MELVYASQSATLCGRLGDRPVRGEGGMEAEHHQQAVKEECFLLLIYYETLHVLRLLLLSISHRVRGGALSIHLFSIGPAAIIY